MATTESMVSRAKFSVTARLAKVQRLDDRTFVHTYDAPVIARTAEPGQFLHIRVSDASAPLLRRPVSILGTEGGRCLRVLFKVIRSGTALLAAKREGESVEIVGPLGRPFPYDWQRDAVMVAGGYGISPVLFLARANRGNHNTRTLIYGARDASQIYLLDEARETFDQVIVTTVDGSLGRCGMVPGPLGDLLDTRANLAVYACGPAPMLKAVGELVAVRGEPGTPCWVSLENRMGCGIGACLGCVVPTRDGRYLTTCKDGPIFAAAEISFD